MIEAAIRALQSHRQLVLEAVRFAIVGGLSVALYSATVALCVFVFKLDVAVATIPGYLASMVVNYTLQKIWTFKSDAHHATAVPKYLFVHAVGIAINYGAVQALMSLAHAPYLAAQIAGVALVATWSYLAQKYWTFATKKAATE